MRKNIIGFALTAMVHAYCLPVWAQQLGMVRRIGYLDASTASGSVVLLNEFRQELSKLGWTEGKNLTVEYRFAEQKPARLPELAAELVRLKVDLIVAPATAPALAAKKATSTIPIVIVTVGDPVGAALINSLARPGGNVTGLSSLVSQLNTKSLEILKDTVPRLNRVGVLSLAKSVGQELQLKEIRTASVALKLNLQEIVIDLKDSESAFQTATQKRVNAVITTSSRQIFAERKRIVELVGKHRLPAIYPQREFVDEGGLMSYGVDNPDLYRRAAVYVDKILKDAKPADLPVEQPTKFEFVINLKTAKQISLTIPPNVLARADRVIR